MNLRNPIGYCTWISRIKSQVDAWMGHSNAEWDGDTLVVRVPVDARYGFDRAGNHHSWEMVVEERWTPMGPNHVQYEATMTDPNTFTQPWKVSFPLYRHIEENYQLLEFKCTEFMKNIYTANGVRRDANRQSSAVATSKKPGPTQVFTSLAVLTTERLYESLLRLACLSLEKARNVVKDFGQWKELLILPEPDEDHIGAFDGGLPTSSFRNFMGAGAGQVAAALYKLSSDAGANYRFTNVIFIWHVLVFAEFFSECDQIRRDLERAYGVSTKRRQTSAVLWRP